MLLVRKPITATARTPANANSFDLKSGIKHIIGDSVLVVTIIITVTMNLFAFPVPANGPRPGRGETHD